MKFKFNEENTIEELEHASPAKPGKHFQYFFVDSILLLLVSYFLFLGANVIATNTSTYKESEIIVKEEVEYYKDYVEVSRAVEFDYIDGERIRTDSITDNNTGISKIVLENRKRATINGVEKALSSNEGCIILKVSGTNLIIMGSGLHIEKLDVESGVIEIEGVLDSFKFAASAKPGSVFKRIFK